MEDLVQAAVLDTPVANQLRVGGTQVNLLIGQFEESSVLFWTDTVGAELIEGSVFLLGASGEARTRLQRREGQSPGSGPGGPPGLQTRLDPEHRDQHHTQTQTDATKHHRRAHRPGDTAGPLLLDINTDPLTLNTGPLILNY